MPAPRFVSQRGGSHSAEREGFEPSVGFLLHPLSKRVPSATRSPLQYGFQSLGGREPSRSGWAVKRDRRGRVFQGF